MKEDLGWEGKGPSTLSLYQVRKGGGPFSLPSQVFLHGSLRLFGSGLIYNKYSIYINVVYLWSKKCFVFAGGWWRTVVWHLKKYVLCVIIACDLYILTKVEAKWLSLNCTLTVKKCRVQLIHMYTIYNVTRFGDYPHSSTVTMVFIMLLGLETILTAVQLLWYL